MRDISPRFPSIMVGLTSLMALLALWGFGISELSILEPSFEHHTDDYMDRNPSYQGFTCGQATEL